jgi:hypothetical protein
VVQVHPGPPFKSPVNTRLFSLFPFSGISLKKPFCQPFVNFTIGRMAVHSRKIPDPVLVAISFVLPRALPSRLPSDLTLTPVDAQTVFPFPLNGRIASYNGGGDCLLVGGNFIVVGKPADILFAELPPIVHIRKESDKAACAGLWSG